MDWSLGGVRIFVTDGNEEANQIVARLQPLSGGTINQIFGYETPIRKLSCYIVGDTDKDAIIALTQSGTKHTLNSPEGSLGDLIVHKVNLPRVAGIISQTLRPDLACDAPVYRGDITLLED